METHNEEERRSLPSRPSTLSRSCEENLLAPHPQNDEDDDVEDDAPSPYNDDAEDEAVMEDDQLSSPEGNPLEDHPGACSLLGMHSLDRDDLFTTTNLAPVLFPREVTD